MQTSDKLEGGADPKFRDPGIDAEGDSVTPSKGDAGNGREVPKNKDAAQAAAGVPSALPGSSPPETNSKRSGVNEAEKLERGRNPSQRSPAINPGGGKAELSDQLKSPIGYQTQEQVGRQADHSGRSTSGDECEEPSKAPVQPIDARNLLTERPETDQDGEILAAVSNALSGHGADTATVRKKSGTPNTANGANEEPLSPASAHQEPPTHEEADELVHVKKADLPGSEMPETRIADQLKLAPPVRNTDSGKSERVSEPEQHNLESGHEATETSSSFKSPTANSSSAAAQTAVNNDDTSIDLQQEESQSEQTDEQSGSEVTAARYDILGNDASDNLAMHLDAFSDQKFDGISARIAQKDDEEVGGAFEDRTEDDDFAVIQSPGASVALTNEDDQCVSADCGSHSSPIADARNSDVAEEPPKTRESAGAQAEDNSRRGRRIAARILAAGTLASACIFASEQFGATAWLIESAQKNQARYSLRLPSSSVRLGDDLGSSIEFIGGGEGRTVEFEPDSNRESANDLDLALPVDDGIGSAPTTDRLIGNADHRAEYSEIPDGKVAPIGLAGRSNSERTDASILESFKIDGGRYAPSDNQSPDSASGTATIKAEPELASSGTANSEDVRVFKLDAPVVEQNADAAVQLHAASASSSSVARPPYEQAFSETADDTEEGLVDPLKVGSLWNVSDNGMSGKPTDSAQQSALLGGNQSIPSKYSASPLSDEIASLHLIPDASGEPANAAVNSSILDKWDALGSTDLNSLWSELDSEFAKINSRLDLMYDRFDLLIAGHEPGSAFLGESKVSDARVFESQNDTNVASDVNCQHSTGRYGQNCEARSRADKGSQPYLIATAQHAADGKFVMPEQGYGVMLDVLKDGAGGWLLVMENATLRLD